MKLRTHNKRAWRRRYQATTEQAYRWFERDKKLRFYTWRDNKIVAHRPKRWHALID